jgi:hypothetical protein
VTLYLSNCDCYWVHCPSLRWYTNTEQWRNNTDRGKQKDSEKKLSQCHLIRHKYYWTALGKNPGLWDEKSTTNRLSYGTAVNIGLKLKVNFIPTAIFKTRKYSTVIIFLITDGHKLCFQTNRVWYSLKSSIINCTALIVHCLIKSNAISLTPGHVARN